MLNVFVLGFGFFCMFTVLLVVTKMMVFLPFSISLLCLLLYIVSMGALNMWITKQAYSSGRKYRGEITGKSMLYGVRYYDIDAGNCKFHIRSNSGGKKIGEDVNIWNIGGISFLDGDNCCLVCDGKIALGFRLIAFLSWVYGAVAIFKPMIIIGVVILIWGIFATDLRLVIKRDEGREEKIDKIALVKGKVYLDLESGKRVKPGYSVYEMYPVGARVTCYGSSADTMSVKVV